MTEYLTFEQATDRLRQATRIVLDNEAEYGKAVERAADAEAVYRAKLAESFTALREAGAAVQEAETRARADVATISRERDYAAGMLKLAGEKLEDARDSRRSLWRLIEWSREHDRPAPSSNGPAQTTLPENAPGKTWP